MVNLLAARQNAWSIMWMIMFNLVAVSQSIPFPNQRRNIRQKANRLRNKGLLGNNRIADKLKNELGIQPREGGVDDPLELCADLWDYHDYDTALEDSASSGKPLMVIISQTWCQACTQLKKKIDRNKYIRELGQVFNIVSLMGDSIPSIDDRPGLYPDGDYFPRVVFVSPDGDVNPDIKNPEAVKQGRMNEYNYWDCESLALSMVEAVRQYLHVSEENLDDNL